MSEEKAPDEAGRGELSQADAFALYLGALCGPPELASELERMDVCGPEDSLEVAHLLRARLLEDAEEELRRLRKGSP